MSGLESGSGGGVNVDLKVCSHPVTYRKLFHLLIGNCFITCRLLIEITFGRASKFESSGDFLNHLVTIALLIELYPVVPFPSMVPLQILRPTFGSVVPPRDPDQSPLSHTTTLRASGTNTRCVSADCMYV